MLNTLGVAQVHPSDAVADSKLQRKLGGKPLLEWIVRRATDCQRLDRVVVLLGTSPADDELAALVPADVSVFRSRQTDQIKRLLEYFSLSQMLFIKSEDLKEHHENTLHRVFDFLGVSRISYIEPAIINDNQYPPMSKSDRMYLLKKFETDIKDLEELLTWDCSAWLTPHDQ